MENILRNRYLKQIRPYYNKQLIKAITGQRRVGKSFLLRQVSEELRSLHKKANFLYIDKEQHNFDGLQTYSQLFDYVKRNSAKGMNYLFLDEVQEIKGFEKALRSLLAEGNYDIYCTGSNSDMFSGELATFLSGRQIEIQVYSLSFSEFA
ncbi:MAG: AAA family ATPase, partial [Bacteroidetes bacterium]|nr:AAA family ATPase [Bacteroidota bacterium]